MRNKGSASSKRHYRLFLASPADVIEERDSLEKVVNNFNLRNNKNIHIDVIRWENHALPDAGRPQAVIFENTDFQKTDIFVGILWSRMGTPTGQEDPATGQEYMSGTMEEIQQGLKLIEEGKLELGRFMLYFCTRPVPIDLADQASKVNDFKKWLDEGKSALKADYNTVEDFKLKFWQHFDEIIHKMVPTPSVVLNTPSQFEDWPSLLRNIHNQRCTPILGPGMTEYLLGSRREIAERWAEKHSLPTSPFDQEQLPQVAQYLAVRHEYDFPRDELQDQIRSEMKHRYGDELRGYLRKHLSNGQPEEELDDKIEAALGMMPLDDQVTLVGNPEDGEGTTGTALRPGAPSNQDFRDHELRRSHVLCIEQGGEKATEGSVSMEGRS